MIFTETKLKGAFIIDLERREDERGFFARAFCPREFAEHGLKQVEVRTLRADGRGGVEPTRTALGFSQ